MPNHPQATTARINAGMLEPNVPNEARNNTGNGIPYRVPACAFSTRGTSTTTLARITVKRACFQLIPASMSPAPSM